MPLISLVKLRRQMDWDKIYTFIHVLNMELLWAAHSTGKVTKGRSKCRENSCHWNEMGSQGRLHPLTDSYLVPHKCILLPSCSVKWRIIVVYF